MLWPARRFEHFYKIHQRRVIIAGMEKQKEQMIAALWSNPNWDDDKDTRAKVIKEINGSFENALKVLDREFEGVAPASDEPDMSTPFFAAAKRGRAKLEKKLVDADTIKPVDFSEYKVDQDG